MKTSLRIILTIAAASVCFGASAATLEVPSVDFPTIASALAFAWNGDEIVVAAGTYYESELMFPQYTTAILRGATGDPEDVIIDGEGNGRVLILQYTETGTRIEDLTVTGGGDTGQGAGLNLWYAVVTVENCIIRENEAGDWGGGVRAYGNTCATSFVDCLFENNHAGNDGGGFCGLSGPVTASFTGCLFRGNSADDDGGALNLYATVATVDHCTFVSNMTVDNGSAISSSNGSATVDHCIITDNDGGAAVFRYSGGAITFTCTNIWGNETDNWTLYQFEDQLGVDGNIEEHPEYCSADGSLENLGLQDDSPCADCEGDYMGAFPVACGDAVVESSDWGSLKALY